MGDLCSPHVYTVFLFCAKEGGVIFPPRSMCDCGCPYQMLDVIPVNMFCSYLRPLSKTAVRTVSVHLMLTSFVELSCADSVCASSVLNTDVRTVSVDLLLLSFVERCGADSVYARVLCGADSAC